jgi:hypothetical protein
VLSAALSSSSLGVGDAQDGASCPRAGLPSGGSPKTTPSPDASTVDASTATRVLRIGMRSFGRLRARLEQRGAATRLQAAARAWASVVWTCVGRTARMSRAQDHVFANKADAIEVLKKYAKGLTDADFDAKNPAYKFGVK